MKIGVDISQIAYGSKGIPNYLANLVKGMIRNDRVNKYILFFSSLRLSLSNSFLEEIDFPNVEVKIFHLPPTLLDLIWNKFHVFPIENLIGEVDIFITSDCLEPPTIKAKKAAIIYDLVIFKNPGVSVKRVIDMQKKRLEWAKEEASIFLCISESTKKDAQKILGLDEKKLRVIYPGI